MNNTFFLLSYFALSVIFTSCDAVSTSPDQSRVNESTPAVFTTFDGLRSDLDLALCDTVYVPIYSDIYTTTIDHRFNLTATLSIRNTSLIHPIYIDNIDYYDTHGDLVREYVNKMLILGPMQSIDFVIEESDTVGGTGANFIVDWCSESEEVYPLLQGVMISTHGQQGISFITEGISTRKK